MSNDDNDSTSTSLGLIRGRVKHIVWAPQRIGKINRKLPQGGLGFQADAKILDLECRICTSVTLTWNSGGGREEGSEEEMAIEEEKPKVTLRFPYGEVSLEEYEDQEEEEVLTTPKFAVSASCTCISYCHAAAQGQILGSIVAGSSWERSSMVFCRRSSDPLCEIGMYADTKWYNSGAVGLYSGTSYPLENLDILIQVLLQKVFLSHECSRANNLSCEEPFTWATTASLDKARKNWKIEVYFRRAEGPVL
ncbi:hypothetical protein Tco_0204150, partial [Tanacetum coccineum]